MNSFDAPLQIGSLTLPHRLIQGPLAGYSCAPFRRLFGYFQPPAYAVSEMISAHDLLTKHQANSRYLARAPDEGILAYQIAGRDPATMAAAAARLQDLGADLIDINCGCPKAKIRQKGAGSALLDDPARLLDIVRQVKAGLRIPLTVKIRIGQLEADERLVKALADEGADALIIHGRRWQDDYGVANNVQRIAQLKRAVTIPVIANGDIQDAASLHQAMKDTGADAFMIARGGSGRPWLYAELRGQLAAIPSMGRRVDLFMQHLDDLAQLESPYQALLQSRSLLRYYFREVLNSAQLADLYQAESLTMLERQLRSAL